MLRPFWKKKKSLKLFMEQLEDRAVPALAAVADFGNTSENATLSVVDTGSSLLNNDTAGPGATLTVVSAPATSAQGATVSINSDGTFLYDPSTSSALQELGAGQSVVDTFTYTVRNNPVSYFAGNTTWDFGAANLQGWSLLNGAVFFRPEEGGGLTPANASGGFAHDPAHTTMLVQSPVFKLNGGTVDGTNALVVEFVGGAGDQNGDGESFSTPAQVLAYNGGNSNSAGEKGLAFLNVATGIYDAVIFENDDGGQNIRSFTLATLIGMGIDTNAEYRLQYYENDDGGWGWGQLNFINIAGGMVEEATATVSITVNGFNEAPVAVVDSYATNEDTAITIAGLTEIPGIYLETYRAGSINDTIASADNARATLSPVATATVALMDVTDPEGHYPAGNFANNIPFPGNTGGDDNNYAVFGTGVLRVLVGGTYTFGSSTDDNSRIRIDLDQDGILEGNLTSLGGGESHPGGGTVLWQGGCCANIFGGAVTLAAGDYKYEMVYSEGGGGSSGEFFYAPGVKTAFDATFRLIGDSSQGIASFAVAEDPGLIGNDGDEEVDLGNATQSLTVTAINGGPGLTGTSALGAIVTANADGSFTYNPNVPGSDVQKLAVGQVANDTFTYTITDNDPNGAKSNTATVTIVVTGVNDAPSATNDTYTVSENVVLTTTDVDVSPRNNAGDATPGNTGDDSVLVNDIDIDTNDALEVVSAQGTTLSGTAGTIDGGSATVTSAMGATVTINDDGTFSYDPTSAPLLQVLGGGETAVDTFTYVATDNRISSNTNLSPAQLGSLVSFGGSYYLLVNSNVTFDQARFNANGLLYQGSIGRLVSFNSVAERDFVTTHASLGAGTSRWIGLTDSQATSSLDGFNYASLGTSEAGTSPTNGWRWLDGTAIVPGVNAWGGGEPNNSGEEDVAHVRADNLWNDWVGGATMGQGGGANLPYLVEFIPAANTTTATVTVNVTGFNEAPVANANNYTANEDNAVSITATVPVFGMNVAVYNRQGSEGGYGTLAGADAIKNTPGRLPDHTGTVLQADFIGNGGSPHFGINNTFPGTANNTDNYALYVTGTLRVLADGTYTFGTNTDDNSRIRITIGGVPTTVAQQNGCCGDIFGTPVFLAAGDYPYEAMYTEGGGGDYGEFFYALGSFTAFDPSFRLIGDASGGIQSISGFVNPGLLGNDTDEEVDLGNANQSLSVVAINGVAGLTGTSTMGAAVTANPDGSFTYNPNIPGSDVQKLAVGQVAIDTFTYTVSDNDPVDPKTSTATVSFTVTGINDLPSAVNDSFTTDENSSFITSDLDVSPRDNIADVTPGDPSDDSVLINDIDIDTNDLLEIVSAQGTTLSGVSGTYGDGSATITTTLGATVTINDRGTFSYDPTGVDVLQRLGAGESLVDSFTYVATDHNLTFTPGINVEVYNQQAGDSSYGNLAGADATRALPGRVPNQTGIVQQADFFGNNAVNPHFTVDNTFPGTGGDNYAVYLTGVLRVNVAGTYTFGTFTDDASRIRVTIGGVPTVVAQQNGCCGDVFGTPVALAVGDYPYEAMYTEGGGGDYGEFFYALGSFTGFNSNFRLIGDPSGGIAAGILAPTATTGTVNITVNGVNESPVANPRSYATSEDTPIVIPAISNISGLNVAVYNQQVGETGYGSLAGADAIRNTPGRVPNQTGTVAQADFIGNGGSPHFTVNNTFPGTGGDNYAVYLTGTLRVDTPGVYTFGVNTDDNSRIRVNIGGSWTTVAQHNGCCNDQFGTPINLAAGDYAIEAMYTEGGGGDYGEFFYAAGSHTSFNSNFRLLGDNNGGLSVFSSITKPGLLGNDTDEEVDLGSVSQFLSVVQINGAGSLTFSSALGASVTVGTDGSFMYNPNVPGSAVQALAVGEIGTDFFTYTVSDNDPVNPKTSTATVTFTITGVNDFPSVLNDIGATNADTVLVTVNGGDASLLVNDTEVDVDGNPPDDVYEVKSVNGTLLSGNPGLGDGSVVVTTAKGATLTVNDDGTFNYDPTASATFIALPQGATDTDTFTYVGHDTHSLLVPGLSVAIYTNQAGDAGYGTLANADATKNLPGRVPNQTGIVLQADFFGNNSGGHYGVNNVFTSIQNNTDNYAVYVTGTLRVVNPGTYTFGTFSDDNSRIRITIGGTPTVVAQQNGCCGDVFGTPVNLSAGDYPFEAMYTEGGGGDFGEFFYAPGSHTAFNSNFRLLGDSAGGIIAGTTLLSEGAATVTVTVTGVNENPVAGDDGIYAADEDTPAVVTAGAIPGINVAVYQGTNNTLASALNAIANGTPSNTGTVSQADFIGNGGSPHFTVNNTFPGTGGDNYAVHLTGILHVVTPGTYTFGLNTDDNSIIRINIGGTLTTVAQHTGCCSDQFGAPVFLAAGDYAWDAIYTEGGGGDYGEFFYAPGSHTSFNSNFRLIGDSAGGIETYRSRIGLLTNDSDIDTGDVLSVDTATVISTHGATITPLADGSFTYDASTSQAAQALKDGETLTDTFDYILHDSYGGTDIGTVTVIVSGVSDLVNDFYDITETNPGAGPTSATPQPYTGAAVVGNDALPGFPTITEVASVNSVTLSGTPGVVGDGSITFNPVIGGTVVLQDNGTFTYDQLGLFDGLDDGESVDFTFDYTVVEPLLASGMRVKVYQPTGVGDLNGADSFLAGARPGEQFNGNRATVNFVNTGGGGNFNGAGSTGTLDDETNVPGLGGGDQNNFVIEATAKIYIPAAGDYTFGVNSDDGFGLRFTGGPGVVSLNAVNGQNDSTSIMGVGGRLQYSAGRGVADTLGTFNFSAPGVYDMRLVNWEGGGGSAVELFAATGSHTGFNSSFRLVGDTVNGGLKVYDPEGVQTPPIATATVIVNGQNDAPVGVANGPYSIDAGETITLDATGSFDVDIEPLTYNWDFDGDGITDFSSATAIAVAPWMATQTAATPLGAGTHTIRLTVNDGDADSVVVTATLTISSTFVYSPTQDGSADRYVFLQNTGGDTLEIRDRVSSTLISSVPKAGITDVIITGTGDDDTLTVNASNGNPVPSGGLVFNAAGGANGLGVVSPALAGDVVYQPNSSTGDPNANSGVVNLAGNDITFQRIGAMDIIAPGSTVTVAPTGGADSISIADGFNQTNAIADTVGTRASLVVSGTTGGGAFQSVAIWNAGTVAVDTTLAGTDSTDIVTINTVTGGSGATLTATNVAVNTGATGDDWINMPASSAVDFSAGTVSLNAGSGIVSSAAGSTLTAASVVVNQAGTSTLAGVVGGAAGLDKQGTGTLTLSAANTHTGGATVSGGVLVVSGSLSTGTVNVNAGTLAGTGTIGGSVVATGAGRVSPGTDAVIGNLTIAGDLSLLGTSTLYIQIDGLTAWDTVTVGGAVEINPSGATITGATINPRPIGSPAILIIDGGTNFTGTFQNATAQPTVTVGSRDYTYTYTGPAAYDFLLTSAPSNIEWDGGGTTNNWTDPLNWVGDAVPFAGDNVIFGDVGVGVRPAPFNNFPANSLFGVRITNTTGAYTITGAAVTLNQNGLVESGVGGSAAVNIALGGATGVTVTGGSLTLGSSVNSYAGDTTVSGGSLTLGTSDAIPDGTGKGNLTVNGTLNMAGFTDTVNAFSGSGVVDNSAGNGVLTVGNTNATSTFGGVLQNTGGTLSLTKIGAGTLTLNGASPNTATGTTTVNDGGLVLAKTGGQSVAGSLVVGDGDNNAQPANVKTAIVRVDTNEQIGNGSSIALAADGRLHVPAGVTETITSPTAFSTADVKIAGTLITTDAYSQPSGTTTLAGGTLRVGVVGLANGVLNMTLGTPGSTNGVLQGSGTIYTNVLTSHGTIDPTAGLTDNDIGNVSVGRLNVRGNLQMTADSVTNLDVGDNGSDQLNVGINTGLALPAGSYTTLSNYDLDPYLRGDVASVTEQSRRGVNDVLVLNGVVRLGGTLNVRPTTTSGTILDYTNLGNSMNFVWRAMNIPTSTALNLRDANLSSVPSDFQTVNSLDVDGTPLTTSGTRFHSRFMGSGGQFNAIGQSVATMTKIGGVSQAVLTAPAYNVGQAKALTLTPISTEATPDTTQMRVTKQLWNARKDSHTRVTVTVTNTSATAQSGPFYLEVLSSPTGSSVFNSAGNRSSVNGGTPYLVVPATTLAPGASVNVEVDLLTPIVMGKYQSLSLRVLRGGLP